MYKIRPFCFVKWGIFQFRFVGTGLFKSVKTSSKSELEGRKAFMPASSTYDDDFMILEPFFHFELPNCDSETNINTLPKPISSPIKLS